MRLSKELKSLVEAVNHYIGYVSCAIPIIEEAGTRFSDYYIQNIAKYATEIVTLQILAEWLSNKSLHDIDGIDFDFDDARCVAKVRRVLTTNIGLKFKPDGKLVYDRTNGCKCFVETYTVDPNSRTSDMKVEVHRISIESFFDNLLQQNREHVYKKLDAWFTKDSALYKVGKSVRQILATSRG